MPRKYMRKRGPSPRQRWTSKNHQEAVKHLKQGDIGLREVFSYYDTPTTVMNRRRKSGDLAKKQHGPLCEIMCTVPGISLLKMKMLPIIPSKNYLVFKRKRCDHVDFT